MTIFRGPTADVCWTWRRRDDRLWFHGDGSLVAVATGPLAFGTPQSRRQAIQHKWNTVPVLIHFTIPVPVKETQVMMVLVIDEKLGCQITEMELDTTHRAVRSRYGNRTRAPQEEGARTRTPKRGCACPGSAAQLRFASTKRTLASVTLKQCLDAQSRLLSLIQDKDDLPGAANHFRE